MYIMSCLPPVSCMSCHVFPLYHICHVMSAPCIMYVMSCLPPVSYNMSCLPPELCILCLSAPCIMYIMPAPVSYMLCHVCPLFYICHVCPLYHVMSAPCIICISCLHYATSSGILVNWNK